MWRQARPGQMPAARGRARVTRIGRGLSDGPGIAGTDLGGAIPGCAIQGEKGLGRAASTASSCRREIGHYPHGGGGGRPGPGRGGEPARYCPARRLGSRPAGRFPYAPAPSGRQEPAAKPAGPARPGRPPAAREDARHRREVRPVRQGRWALGLRRSGLKAGRIASRPRLGQSAVGLPSQVRTLESAGGGEAGSHSAEMALERRVRSPPAVEEGGGCIGCAATQGMSRCPSALLCPPF